MRESYERPHSNPERKRMSEGEQQEKVESIVSSFKKSLEMYLRQPQADPEVLGNVNYIIANLSNALMYAGDAGGGKSREDDLDAVMRGVGMVLDPARDSKGDLDGTARPTAERFVEIVNRRFVSLQESK